MKNRLFKNDNLGSYLPQVYFLLKFSRRDKKYYILYIAAIQRPKSFEVDALNVIFRKNTDDVAPRLMGNTIFNILFSGIANLTRKTILLLLFFDCKSINTLCLFLIQYAHIVSLLEYTYKI